MTNFHVSALISDGKLTLLYQLQPGVCDLSFGIDVDKIYDFPEEVIENAKKSISKFEVINLIEKKNLVKRQNNRD